MTGDFDTGSGHWRFYLPPPVGAHADARTVGACSGVLGVRQGCPQWMDRAVTPSGNLRTHATSR